MTQTPTDALRLVPRRAVYDWLRDDVPLTVKMTVMPHHIDALMDRLSKAASASPLPGGGWRTDFENAPKDGRWIVTVDKWKNVEAMRWSKEVSRFNPEQGERGWIAKNGYPPNTRPELCVEWSELPAAPTGDAT